MRDVQYFHYYCDLFDRDKNCSAGKGDHIALGEAMYLFPCDINLLFCVCVCVSCVCVHVCVFMCVCSCVCVHVCVFMCVCSSITEYINVVNYNTQACGIFLTFWTDDHSILLKKVNYGLDNIINNNNNNNWLGWNEVSHTTRFTVRNSYYSFWWLI